MQRLKLCASMIAICAAWCGQASAQDSAGGTRATVPPEQSGPDVEASGGQQEGIGDIIVKAQRRSESLQRVPIAITALTSTALENAGVSGVTAIATITPGLQLPQNRNAVNPYIRGVGSQNVTPGDEGASAIYIDGILNASAGGNIFALNNVDRVEILRGPQGTLFGRNAVGGLINIITRTPNDEQQFKASIGYGNYDTWTGQLYVAGGVTEGVAADLALYGVRQDKGWGRNLFLNEEVN
jgi:iron complex outermembrane receptor protein